MDHAEVDALLGAYVLDACSPIEEAAIQVHLEACPVCRATVDTFYEAAGWLGVDSGETPPRKLRSRILDAAAKSDSE